MADTTFTGFTTPSQPNSGIAFFDTNGSPSQDTSFPAASDVVAESPVEQLSVLAAYDSLHVAQIPVRVKTIVDDGANLQVTIDMPVMLDPATETHSGYAKWKYGTPTVSNTAADGTIITVITRFLRRLSKLNRGAN